MNITANGASSTLNWVLAPKGSGGVMMTSGNYDGATIKLQFSIDNGVTWVDVVSTTVVGVTPFALGSALVRFFTSGGGGSLDVNIQLTPVEGVQTGISGSPATEATLLSLLDENQPKSLRVDATTTAGYTYVGTAAPGSAAASAVWRISKIDNTTGDIIWAGGTTDYTYVWNDRATTVVYS